MACIAPSASRIEASASLSWSGSSGFGRNGVRAPLAASRGAGAAGQSEATRGRRLVIRAVRPEPRKQNEERVKGIFEFVIDNPSSKGAIQLDSEPDRDGNLGQLIGSTKNKGRDFGNYYMVGDFQYFIRETGPKIGPLSLPTNKLVLFLHGAPAQSWGYRNVMQQLADKGFSSVAPDFLGFGFSEKPQAGYYFAYTEEAYHAELDKILEMLEIKKPIYVVTQGFLTGSYGLTWALKNKDKVKAVGILNTPVTPACRLPAELASLRLPFVGEFACQNAVLAERFIEKGSPYRLEDDDADVYRLPYLDSGEPGFALLEVARKFDEKKILSKIQDGFAKGKGWTAPLGVLWGPQDPYLSESEAKAFADASNADFRPLGGAGHMPQEDWAEKVTDGLLSLFSRAK